MPVRITIDGATYETDTAAEAVEIHKLVQSITANKSIAARRAYSATYETNGAPQFATFANSLNDNGKAVVRALVHSHPTQLDTEELAAAAKLKTMSLPPIIKHIRSAAIKAHLEPESAIMRRQMTDEGKPTSRYSMGERVAEELKRLL